MTMLISIFSFLLAIGILVSFHEYGHYLAAKLCGVHVERFSLGFGTPLVKFQKNQYSTQWVIGYLPLGGYVKMNEESFNTKSLWKRSLVVFSGPLANFLLAIFLLVILYISGVKQLPAKLAEPPAQTLAYQVGIDNGDVVTGWKTNLNDPIQPIISWNQLRWRLMDAITSHEDFWLEIHSHEGDNRLFQFSSNNFPTLNPEIDPIYSLGIAPSLHEPIELIDYQLSPLEAFSVASQRVKDITLISVRMIKGLFTGESSFKQLGGPISIASMAGKSAQVGWQSFVAFLSLISISLGILNLLPFPMLDGGQLMYDAWELVTGRKISPDWRYQLQRFGVICLLFLTFLAMFNDVTRLFVR